MWFPLLENGTGSNSKKEALNQVSPEAQGVLAEELAVGELPQQD